eukprot:gnl/MRDRNA2_/MRDRNA2_96939_c0_seq1.p1 gnl/MRDRNA2_/MRDRNA2_96939_c0~~gnl/MRDRNA2_/MRDRNA2_96939_c0_seq1.p1  ORF type:complete len:377 (+),score=72.17 gnl/MRDRNA2_/MRDRNA2_96939_c0_seq1:85-1215(+)
MRWVQALSAIAAIVAGVSVTLQLGGTIALNGKAEPNQSVEKHALHSMYVSQGSYFVGAVWLAVFAAAMPGDPPKCPQKFWSTLGGIIILPSFVTTPAAQVLGLQLVLMLLLLGMVWAALLFDCQAHRLDLSRVRKGGLAFIFIGVVLELLDAVPHVNGPPIEIILYVVGCLLVGVLFAVQSKMNVRLARDLGSSFRSATFCNLSAVLVGIALLFGVRYAFHVQYELKADQWWIWLLVGLQSAFYTLMLTLLPKKLGYSAMFVLVLAGKLGSSAMADTLGAFQAAVPLSALRCASVSVMLIGAILYTLVPSAAVQGTDDTTASPRPVRVGIYAEYHDEVEEDAAMMENGVQPVPGKNIVDGVEADESTGVNDPPSGG